MIFAYKIFTGNLGLDKNDIFQSSSSGIRGHEYRVVRRKATKFCRRNAFSNRIINDWNSIPPKIIAATSIDLFKNSLDKYWKEEMFTTLF